MTQLHYQTTYSNTSKAYDFSDRVVEIDGRQNFDVYVGKRKVGWVELALTAHVTPDTTHVTRQFGSMDIKTMFRATKVTRYKNGRDLNGVPVTSIPDMRKEAEQIVADQYAAFRSETGL